MIHTSSSGNGRQIVAGGIPLAEDSRPCFVVGSPNKADPVVAYRGFPNQTQPRACSCNNRVDQRCFCTATGNKESRLLGVCSRKVDCGVDKTGGKIDLDPDSYDEAGSHCPLEFDENLETRKSEPSLLDTSLKKED